MNIKLNGRWFHAALIVVLAVWILHDFVQAILAACVAAVASWPLFVRFRSLLAPWLGRNATALAFTGLMAVFVLAPMVLGFTALLTEAHTMLAELASADARGVPAPHWLDEVPIVGRWLSSRWHRELAHAGALSMWAERAESSAWLGWAQSVGQFVARHLFIIVFAILMLFFLYQEGDALARDFRRILRGSVGERAEAYVAVAARSARASVNSVLVVGLFNGFAAWGAYAIVGVPHAGVWAALTGAFSLVPFVGYVAVAALALQLWMTLAGTSAFLAFALGCAVLFCGDKLVRPLVARDGTRLPFVWVLMGCLGGFEALGLVGIVVGPVVLTLARELWDQRARDLARTEGVEAQVLVRSPAGRR